MEPLNALMAGLAVLALFAIGGFIIGKIEG
jgi:hypothetical protein